MTSQSEEKYNALLDSFVSIAEVNITIRGINTLNKFNRILKRIGYIDLRGFISMTFFYGVKKGLEYRDNGGKYTGSTSQILSIPIDDKTKHILNAIAIKVDKLSKYDREFYSSIREIIFKALIIEVINIQPTEELKQGVKNVMDKFLTELNLIHGIPTMGDFIKKIPTAIIKDYNVIRNNAKQTKILWIKSSDELLQIIDKTIQDKLILKGQTTEQLAFSLFCIKEDNRTFDLQIQFNKEERNTLVFFCELIENKCIDYSLLDTEILNKICALCLNKTGKKYKVQQLQTVINKYGINPNNIS